MNCGSERFRSSDAAKWITSSVFRSSAYKWSVAYQMSSGLRFPRCAIQRPSGLNTGDRSGPGLFVSRSGSTVESASRGIRNRSELPEASASPPPGGRTLTNTISDESGENTGEPSS